MSSSDLTVGANVIGDSLNHIGVIVLVSFKTASVHRKCILKKAEPLCNEKIPLMSHFLLYSPVVSFRTS